MPNQVLPNVQAIILCDHIYRDDETGKCVLAGTFNRVFLEQVPGEYHPASIYLNLTDFHVQHSIQFRFIRLTDQAILDESPQFVFSHDDRREPHECIFDLPPLARAVEIRRTSYGVPHILAESLEAAAFGLAWVMMEDYREDIPEQILSVNGRWARGRGSPMGHVCERPV